MFAGKYLIQENTNLPKSGIRFAHSHTFCRPDLYVPTVVHGEHGVMLEHKLCAHNEFHSSLAGWRPCYQCSVGCLGNGETVLKREHISPIYDVGWKLGKWRPRVEEEPVSMFGHEPTPERAFGTRGTTRR